MCTIASFEGFVWTWPVFCSVAILWENGQMLNFWLVKMLSKSSMTDSPNPCANIPLGAVSILILVLADGFQNVCQYFNIWNVRNSRQQERKRVIFLKMAVKRRHFPCTTCWIKNPTLKKAGNGEHSAIRPQWKLDAGFNLCNALGTCCTHLGPERHTVGKPELSSFCWPGNKPWLAISLG